VVFATALVLRLVYVWQLQASPYFADHVMDPGYHHEWARAFAAGETFWKQPYFRAPLYPWFLGTIYWLFGADNPFAPRIVQAVIGSLSCALLYLIGRQFLGRPTGILAGFAAATYWIFLYYDAELLIPVLIVFLDLLLLWLLLRTGDRRNAAAWGACGLVLGLSAIARPNVLLFAPALVVWIFVLHWPRRIRATAYAACLFVGCVLPIVPITIRNYVVGDDFVLIAAQGGVNLYIGNNRHSDGMSAIIKGDPGEWQACYEAQIARAEKAAGRPLKPSEVSQWYARQSLRFMYQEPARAGLLLLKKLGYFWSHWEVSNNQDIRFITSRYTPIVRYLPLTFWIVGPLGVLGLVLSLRRAKTLFPLWGFVLAYMVSVVLFFVTARYRVPVVAVLILLASLGVCWLGQALRARRWRALGGAALVLAAMGLITARTPPKVDKTMVQEHRETGMFLAHRGEFAGAEDLLREAARRTAALGHAPDAKTWYYLGFAQLKQEKFADAVASFEQVVNLRPHYPGARSQLGYALAALGRYEAAAEHFAQLVQDDPQDATARTNLASALARLGRTDQVIEHLLAAVELDRSKTRALVETAEALRERGAADDALRLLRSAAERFPNELSLTAVLIEFLVQRPDAASRAEAVRLAEQACERSHGQNAPMLHVAALAYFNAGQLQKAIETERRAIEVARRQGRAALVEQFRRTLQQYESAPGRPLPAQPGP
jgi:tetratricopeptide (TPR) repeat protein